MVPYSFIWLISDTYIGSVRIHYTVYIGSVWFRTYGSNSFLFYIVFNCVFRYQRMVTVCTVQ